MPSYLTNLSSWQSIWPILLAAFLLAFGASFFISNKKNRNELRLGFLAFAMLGMTTGFLSGNSREPVMEAVIPSILSLIGGLLAFMVVNKSKDNDSKKEISTDSMVTSFIGVFIFTLTLLLGSSWGAIAREDWEKFKNSKEYLMWKSYDEYEVNKYRKSLGLPPLKNKH